MKRSFAAIVILLLVNILSAKAQSDYKIATGLRVGWPTGISAKWFIGKSWALEGIGTARYRGLGLTLLIEKHITAFNSENFNWFVGGGLHGSFFSGQYYNGPHKRHYKEDSFSYGLDGIGGLEYVFSRLPLTLGIDVKPAIEVNYGPYFDLGAAGTVRYVF